MKIEPGQETEAVLALARAIREQTRRLGLESHLVAAALTVATVAAFKAEALELPDALRSFATAWQGPGI